jgi:hypothetical protein
MVVAVTVGNGVTTMAMIVHYTSPYQTVCRQFAKTVNICHFAAFHTMHHLAIKRSE